MKKNIAKIVMIVIAVWAMLYAALNVDAIMTLTSDALAAFILFILMDFVALMVLMSGEGEED